MIIIFLSSFVRRGGCSLRVRQKANPRQLAGDLGVEYLFCSFAALGYS
jgi:hypothetical protein